MAKEDTRGLRKKTVRQRARRRKELEHEAVPTALQPRVRGIWRNGGRQSLLTLLFAAAVIAICFVGQDPPGLRTLGEYAPENVYSDRNFHYLSEVRREQAEEALRRSTPREYARNFKPMRNNSKRLSSDWRTSFSPSVPWMMRRRLLRSFP